MKCPKCNIAVLELNEDRRSKSVSQVCKVCGYRDWLALGGEMVIK